MKLLDALSKAFTQRETRPFNSLHSLVLAIIGVGAFIVAGYWGLMLKEVVPELIKATNSAGITLPAIALWSLLSIYAAGVWFFGCIAARCHSILYDRWFK